MTEQMNYAGYLSARQKLANMEARLAVLRARTDLHPSHRSAAERSYLDMIGQYRREIKEYEMSHAKDGLKTNGTLSHQESPSHEKQVEAE